ncbi:MAG: hypothetical protein NZO58_02980 [Gemmataceae bacterium]|nr:hypothetical protein [Gemmataceae bacterium]
MISAVSLVTDPPWPWSLPGVGVGALAAVAAALAGLTVITYLGAAKATPRRLAAVVGLRLLALAVALIVILRPSLAHDEDDNIVPSKLLVHLDISESMGRTDEFDNRSRYEHAKRLLTSGRAATLLKSLSAERKIEVVYSMGAEDVRPLEFPAKPVGRRTDIGTWLHELWQRHGREKNLRGLVLLTDGADNGTRFAALDQAAAYRGVCPIYAIGLGSPTTTAATKDIAVEKVWVKEPVFAKGTMEVAATVAAPGFEDAVVLASLWLEEVDGKPLRQVGARQPLDLRTQLDKTIRFQVDAPDRQGEVKLTVKVEPLPGEVNVANNEASTYVNVSKEGVSILWVEGKLRLESGFARETLAKDPRLRVFRVLRLPGDKAVANGDFFEFGKRSYDVIVIGDLSAQRFSGGRPEVFDAIRDLVVTKGVGLLMLGGYDTFAAGGWRETKIYPLLPVKLDAAVPQVETKIRVTPTPAGELFLLKLASAPAKQKELWESRFQPLDGMAALGTVEPGATVYAHGTTAAGQELPLLVSIERGQGRVLVFGGDTTYLAWRQSKEAIAAYERFWSQVMLWLAKQEQAKGYLVVRPDRRRLDLGGNDVLGFNVKFTKGANKVRQAKFDAKIVGPRGELAPVTIVEEADGFRGTWSAPPAAGEYRIVVEGSGVDEQQQPVHGADVARFMVYDDDVENLRPAADHELLKRIAQVSGGEFFPAEERKFVQFLEKLPPLIDAERTTAVRWPDWRRNPVSDSVGDQLSALWDSAALPCFLAFVALLCLEWFLRRRWGLV